MTATCNCDATVDFDHLAPGAWVKVAGEWHEVIVINRTRRTLQLRPVEFGAMWEWTPPEGPLTVAPPF